MVSSSRASATAEQVKGLVAAGTSSPDMLESALREDYPVATVRPRALSGEPDLVWYVYRDGHWIAE